MAPHKTAWISGHCLADGCGCWFASCKKSFTTKDDKMRQDLLYFHFSYLQCEIFNVELTRSCKPELFDCVFVQLHFVLYFALFVAVN